MDDTKPHFDPDGTLVIPFECSDHAYKYWKQEGKPLTDILKELGTDEATWARYTHLPFPSDNGDGSGGGDGPDDGAEG
ncbi:hypothetical protein [Pseudodesulfovibrio sp.]|uniref:hypothetical protein n=1 Tax=Pseudodesulfovibrio sp. TaxID=2035812 RepID=UPI002607425A|nr:hypothetical protein [Pseudodesulfovibrio sp.]MDD3312467.1 hypothetical protein [Pseudodesulfovibrio sp.]